MKLEQVPVTGTEKKDDLTARLKVYPSSMRLSTAETWERWRGIGHRLMNL
ncbi:MAG TPA: hypothetical protein VLW47_09955 [Thermodesulfobacteriota bacterium]|nr:hypothetical protein [Thermodesulfobacteriota bacterium]